MLNLLNLPCLRGLLHYDKKLETLPWLASKQFLEIHKKTCVISNSELRSIICLKKQMQIQKPHLQNPNKHPSPLYWRMFPYEKKKLSCSSHKGCSTSGIPWMHPADCQRRSLGKSFENGSLRNGAVGGHPNGHHTYCCTYTWERGSLKTTSWLSWLSVFFTKFVGQNETTRNNRRKI